MARLLRRPWLVVAQPDLLSDLSRSAGSQFLQPQPASLAPEGSTGPVEVAWCELASRLILTVAIHIRGTNDRSQRRRPDDREFPKAQ